MIGYVCSGCVGVGACGCGWGVWVCAVMWSCVLSNVTYNVRTPFMPLMHAVCPDIFGCGSICVSPDHFNHWTLQVSLVST